MIDPGNGVLFIEKPFAPKVLLEAASQFLDWSVQCLMPCERGGPCGGSAWLLFMSLGGVSLRSRLRRSGPFRYAFAVLLACVAAALQYGVQWLVGPGEDTGSYQFLLGATALSAVWTGRSSAFVTLACSALFKLYYFLPPANSFRIETTATLVHLILFCAVGSRDLHRGWRLVRIPGKSLQHAEQYRRCRSGHRRQKAGPLHEPGGGVPERLEEGHGRRADHQRGASGRR